MTYPDRTPRFYTELQPAIPRWELVVGGGLVRYIYVDEAGHEETAPITVIAGVIIHADAQYVATEKRLAEVLQAVPERHRKDFIFHATQIWGDDKYRDGWSIGDRIKLLCDVVAIPLQTYLGLSFGFAARHHNGDPDGELDLADYHYAHAFGLGIAQADQYIRECGLRDEVATVVCEDTNKKKHLTKSAKRFMRQTFRPPEYLIDGTENNALFRDGKVAFRITRVRDGIHYVSKHDGPLLQLADACAYGMRRFFENHQYAKGEDIGMLMMRAMCGGRTSLIDGLIALRERLPTHPAGSIVVYDRADRYRGPATQWRFVKTTYTLPDF